MGQFHQGYYQASVGGGCVDSSGNPVDISDWSGVSFGSCQNVTPDLTGYYKNSCTVTYQSKTLTCTNEWGVFHDQALTSPVAGTGGNPPNFDFNTVQQLMTQGQSCATVSNALAQAQCYSQYYQQYIQNNISGCIPQVQTNWTATSAADFVHVSFRPNSLVFMDKLNYADANTASLLTEQQQYQGVQIQNSSGNNQFVNCAVQEKDGLTLKKISDTKILATYVSATTTSTIDQPACVATYGDTTSKFIFYLEKQ